jgi:cystathionine beta-lyase
MGGHSDILAGTVISTEEHINTIFQLAKNFGGNLSDYTVWLLERSIKTMGLRVKAQNKNAKKLAKYLEKHEDVERVYYPGLKSHPDHELAKSQMRGFGGMLSFELKEGINASLFQKQLKMIKPSMSLAGVESTILLPTLTSHALLSAEEREAEGIKDNLMRFSVGIEEKEDLIADLEQALEAVKELKA